MISGWPAKNHFWVFWLSFLSLLSYWKLRLELGTGATQFFSNAERSTRLIPVKKAHTMQNDSQSGRDAALLATVRR